MPRLPAIQQTAFIMSCHVMVHSVMIILEVSRWFTTLITRATTRGSPSLGLPFRSISLSTTSQIGLPAEAFGYCYYQNEAAHDVIKLLHHRCWMRKM